MRARARGSPSPAGPERIPPAGYVKRRFKLGFDPRPCTSTGTSTPPLALQKGRQHRRSHLAGDLRRAAHALGGATRPKPAGCAPRWPASSRPTNRAAAADVPLRVRKVISEARAATGSGGHSWSRRTSGRRRGCRRRPGPCCRRRRRRTAASLSRPETGGTPYLKGMFHRLAVLSFRAAGSPSFYSMRVHRPLRRRPRDRVRALLRRQGPPGLPRVPPHAVRPRPPPEDPQRRVERRGERARRARRQRLRPRPRAARFGRCSDERSSLGTVRVDGFPGTRARGTLASKRRRIARAPRRRRTTGRSRASSSARARACAWS